MTRFRIECEGCTLDETIADDRPPADVPADEWSAESAVKEIQSNHRLCEGSVQVERIE